MNSKMRTIVTGALIGLLIFFSGIGTAFYFSEERTSNSERESVLQNSLYLHSKFPRGVMDGYVLDVDRNKKEIKFLALTENMIINPPRASKELTVKVDDSTIFAIYNFETDEEEKIDFENIEIWDDLAVVTRENPLELFERNEFTAIKITKRVGGPFTVTQ